MSEVEQAIKWAGVLIVKNRRILTLKENDKSFYVLPGGKVEAGEADEQAAVREVLEELGVVVDVGELFTEINENSKSTGQLIRFKLFTGSLQAAPDIHKLPGKTTDIAYINSQHAQEGIDVGNLLIKLLPILVKQGLID